jgi:pimeloyl-ACP methyl ester carboxylesterase
VRIPNSRTANLLLALAVGVSTPVQGQAVTGSWEGKLDVGGGNQLTLRFNLELNDDGALTGTMDSPDQGANGLPLTSATFEDGVLTLVVGGIPGSPTVTGTLSEDGAAISATFSQGGASFPLELAKLDGPRPPPSRPQEPKPPYPYRVEGVTFPNQSAGIDLAGTMTFPEGAGPFPGVVLVSGSGPQDRDQALMGHKPFHVLADHLTRQGIAVLRFDDRGVGDSGGEFATATSEDFATDAVAATSYLVSRPEVADDQVGVAGHSEGGMIAPMALALSDQIAYIVLLAGPAVSGQDILREQQKLIATASGATSQMIDLNARILNAVVEVMTAESDPDVAEPIMREAIRAEIDKLSPEFRAAAGDALGETLVDQTVTQMNSVWFRFFLGYDPRPALEAVTVPVLALFGEKDLQVPPSQSAPEMEAAFERAGHSDATVLVLPGLNHLFQEAETGSPSEYAQIEQTMSPTALQAISSWIQERFGAGATIRER